MNCKFKGCKKALVITKKYCCTLHRVKAYQARKKEKKEALIGRR